MDKIHRCHSELIGIVANKETGENIMFEQNKSTLFIQMRYFECYLYNPTDNRLRCVWEFHPECLSQRQALIQLLIAIYHEDAENGYKMGGFDFWFAQWGIELTHSERVTFSIRGD